jgi:tetratricopeptide (TPR) repeat protein
LRSDPELRRARVFAAACLLLAVTSLAAVRPSHAQEVTCPPPGSAQGSSEREACRLILEGLEAYRQGEYRLAAHRFEEASEVSPGFEPALAQYWFGRSLLGVGRAREAAFALYRALRAEQAADDPDPLRLSRTRLWLGKTYDLLGRRGAALEWYRQVVDSGGTAEEREEARRYVAHPFEEDPAPTPPEVRTLRSVLRRLYAAEQAHWQSYARYSDDVTELGLEVPQGVRLEIGLLDNGVGFVAHGRSPDGAYSCRVVSGRGTEPGDRGIVFCP